MYLSFQSFLLFYTHPFTFVGYPYTIIKPSMSLPKEQQEDTSSSMTSSEARPEESKSEEELNAM